MTGVEHVMRKYLGPRDFTADDATLGTRRQALFAEQLEIVRRRNRVGFWICVGMVILLFVAVLLRTYQSFSQLPQVNIGTVTSIFGVSASGAVVMMIRLSRETTRADMLLVLLNELRDRDPDAFRQLLIQLCNKWYGLKK
jgi:hypothetical protein